MSPESIIQQRIDAYLSAVERHLATKSPAAREEVLSSLRDQILAALEEDSAPATPEKIERILGTMDDPACYADDDYTAHEHLAVIAPPPARPVASANRWFFLALAFFCLNAYGVWRWTSQPAAPAITPEPPRPEVVAAVSNRIDALRLLAVEQADITADRHVSLRLTFNGRPDAQFLAKHLTLKSQSGEPVPFSVAPFVGTNQVMLSTAPVMDSRMSFVLDAGLPAMTNLAPSAQKFWGEIGLDPTFQFKGMEASMSAFDDGHIRAIFSLMPEAAGIARYVTIEPAVTFTVEAGDDYRGGGAMINGKLEPGRVYTVTFKEGMPAANGARLPADVVRTVQMPERGRDLQVDQPGIYLAPQGALTIPVRLVNVDEWTAALRPIVPGNLVQYAIREGGWYYGNGIVDDLTSAAMTLTNRVVAAPNEIVNTRLHLRDLSDKPLRGMYWLNLGYGNRQPVGRLLVITDLGLASRTYPGGILVWVNSLTHAIPEAGVEVSVYARNNEVVASGRTDERGLINLTFPEEVTPFLITATKGDDRSMLALSHESVESGHFNISGPPFLAADGIEAAVFTERGVYRPGETVFMQALARDRAMLAPAPFPALFRVVRPDGHTFRDLPVMLNEFGSATAEVALPDFLPTGRYTVQLVMPGTFTRLGETTLALEDFVPPQIRVNLTASTNRFSSGRDLHFTIQADHLFGSAAGGLKASGFAAIKEAPFAPEAYRDWQFGDAHKSFATLYRPLGTATLDDEGSVRFRVETSAAWRPPAALEVVQQGVVVEAGGRTVTAYGSTILDPYPFYIGLRPAWEGSIRAGVTQRVGVVRVAPDGTPVLLGKPLVVSLSRVRWNSVLRQNSRGRYEWQSDRQAIAVLDDTIAAGSESEWTFAVHTPGEYELLVRDPSSGASTRIQFYAGSGSHDAVDWSRERPGRIDLTMDRDVYQPGDTARLLIKAPFSGQALLTIESDTLHETRLVTLEENTAEIEIPVHAAYAPNVYAVVTLIRPARPAAVWRAHRAIGVAAIRVTPPNRDLTVTIEAPERILPLTTLTVPVSVRDAEGAPVKGEVTVMAVDEGICMLTGHETPRPNDTFRVRRWLRFLPYDMYSDLMPIFDDQLDAVSAPGGDANSGLRGRLNPIKANRFRPVSLWHRPVALDDDGRAVVTLDVPEFTGQLRVMAVAVNDRQAGSAAKPVQVKRDLVVQSFLPRFMAPGDAAEATISLFNERDKPMEINLAIITEHRARSAELRTGFAGEIITLDGGASTNVVVMLHAGDRPGVGYCRVEVTADGIDFREVIELPVRPAASWQVTANAHVVAPGASVTLTAPDAYLPPTVSSAGGVSALPAIRYTRALDYLVNYPYGCLEQTVSGAFPLLYAADWLERLPPGPVARPDAQGLVASALTRVLSMQQADGGFSLWPFERGSDDAASLYGIHFVIEARAAGYDVPAERIDAGLRWLRQRLDRETILDVVSEAWQTDMSDRAYAAHILALARAPSAGWNARLTEVAARLPFAAWVHTASALLLSGDPRTAVALLNQLGLPAERPRIPGRFLSSEVREAALLLRAWLEIEPDHEAVVRLIQYLEGQARDGHWGNTQDNAMALLALGKYYQQRGGRPETFTGTITLPDGTARSITHEHGGNWNLATGESGDVTVSNSGPGLMYLWSRIKGVPGEPPAAIDQGVSVRRVFYDLMGDEVQPSTIKRGDMVIVKLTVNTLDRVLDQLVIEDLLPAGWEIENPNLATSQQFGWVTEKNSAVRFRDARDDRMLIFTGSIHGERHYYYAARAVSAGRFALPPVTVAGMYEPEIHSISGGGMVEVAP